MADQPSPDAKALAEIRKLEAETAKLDAEVRDLNRTPWQRPGAWVALGSGLVAIVAGLITIPSGYFDRIKTIAEQQAKISDQAAAISKQAVDAAKQQAELNKIESELQEHKLRDQLDSMQAEKARIEKDRERSLAEFRVKEAAATKSLTDQKTALEATKLERANLQRDLAVARSRDYLNGLERADDAYRASLKGMDLAARLSTRADLRNAVQVIATELSITDAYSSARRDLVASTADRLQGKPVLAALLLYALDTGAKDSSRRAKFLEIAEATAYPPEMAEMEFLDQLPALPFELAVLGPFPGEQKAKLLCDVTAAVGASKVDRFLKASRYYVLGAEDEGLLDLCGAPFLGALIENRSLAFDAIIGNEAARSTLPKRSTPEAVLSTTWPKVNALCPQAAAIYLADLTVRAHRDLTGILVFRVAGQNLPLLRYLRYMLTPGRMPPPSQLPPPFGFTVDQLKADEWPAWLEAHRTLVDFWMEPDLGTLRSHPELMKKAVRGIWIKDEEIPKGAGRTE